MQLRYHLIVSSAHNFAPNVLRGNHLQEQCHNLRKKKNHLNEVFAVPLYLSHHNVSPTHMVNRTVLYDLAQQNHLCLHETSLTAIGFWSRLMHTCCAAQVQVGRKKTQ